ncbi:hypothetical protein [Actinokineospora sp. NBRC 105648]|uniref:hypothetical protein n=1 Tax=Actinokineospora sp. NBRC 105648 TaxID=3032206 RepID=UPI0025532DD5|nr:hypothetical protein [Actinokineospora sp. NBRC 105648]
MYEYDDWQGTMMLITEWSVRLLSLSDALSVPDGGFSIDPRTGADLRIGYAVAIHPEHERIFTNRVTAGDLIEYVADVADTLARPGRVLGGWRDPDSGSVYLDVSAVVSTLAEAWSLAVRYNQLAVFDLASMMSVQVATTNTV